MKEFIKSARQLISDYADAASPQLAQCGDFLQSHKRAQTATKLYVSSAMTTDSIIILIEHGLIWDAISLFRSLLEGTARFCYLLSTTTEEEEIKRFHEYEEVLSGKSMMSLEQPVAKMKKGHLYKHDKTDAYLDRIDFPTRLSNRAVPRATVVGVDPRRESRGSAGKTGSSGMD